MSFLIKIYSRWNHKIAKMDGKNTLFPSAIEKKKQQQYTYKFIISKCRLKSEIDVEKSVWFSLLFFLVSASHHHHIRPSSLHTLLHRYLQKNLCLVAHWMADGRRRTESVIFYSISLCRIDERFFFLFARLFCWIQSCWNFTNRENDKNNIALALSHNVTSISLCVFMDIFVSWNSPECNECRDAWAHEANIS